MALVEMLNAREHLELFCEIRGVKRAQVNDEVSELLEGMDLLMNKNNLVGRYSGGNKRKLMVAVAMCGKPEIVFLDEPSAGMDPEARRKMWNIIRDIKEKGCSVVLTTHSMEEAEALANRIVVMHLGRVRCLGHAQKLKDKMGTGYEAFVKFKKPNRKVIEHMRRT